MTAPKQVNIKLVTSLGREFRVPEAQLAVPADVTRYGLSTIINHMLHLDPPRVFDFILDGELLRDTLGESLLAKSVSTESAVVLEYTLLAVPPKLTHSAPQKDWIRGIACMPGGWIVIATAQGDIAVHSHEGAQINAAQAHEGGALALCMLPDAGEGVGAAEGGGSDRQHDAACMMMSGGQDCAVKIWRVTDTSSPAAVLRLDAHTDTVATVAATSSLAATGGWDHTIHLWRWPPLVADAAAGDLSAKGEAKRSARVAAEAADEPAVAATATAGNSAVVADSAAALEGHAQAVTGLCFAGAHTLMSSAMDNTLKRWDTTTGSAVDSIATGKAMLCCASSAAEGGSGGGALVATGAVDGTLRWWDCRAGAKKSEALAIRAYKAHAAPVAAVAWRPHSDHNCASASLDGTVKLWDNRSALPLATLDDAEGSKLSAVVWGSHNSGGGGLFVAAGGEDAVLRQYGVPDIGVRVEA